MPLASRSTGQQLSGSCGGICKENVGPAERTGFRTLLTLSQSHHLRQESVAPTGHESPQGTRDNSPPFQRRVKAQEPRVPAGDG